MHFAKGGARRVAAISRPCSSSVRVLLTGLIALVVLVIPGQASAAWSGAAEISDAGTRGAPRWMSTPIPSATSSSAGAIGDRRRRDRRRSGRAPGPAPRSSSLGDYGDPTVGIGGNGVARDRLRVARWARPNYGIFAREQSRRRRTPSGAGRRSIGPPATTTGSRIRSSPSTASAPASSSTASARPDLRLRQPARSPAAC